MQQVTASLLRRDELLDLLAEKESSDLVVVDDRRKRKHSGNLGKHVLPARAYGSEKPRAADIDQKHDGQFPLLFEDLHIRRTHARSDIPVHVAHIIAILVLAHFTEGHTAALEGRMVLTRKDLVRERPGLDLYLPDLLQKVIC